VLRAAHGAAGIGDDLEQADLAHPLEVGPDRVGVEAEGVRDLRGGQGHRRARELEVDRVAGVVAERLEELQARCRGVATELDHRPWSLHGSHQ
jgi:hypothetical protein